MPARFPSPERRHHPAWSAVKTLWFNPSFRLETELADHRRPALDLALDVGPRLLRRRALQIDADEFVAEAGLRHDLAQLGVELRQDRPRRTGGRQQHVPLR